jgi:hypothetical protein
VCEAIIREDSELMALVRKKSRRIRRAFRQRHSEYEQYEQSFASCSMCKQHLARHPSSPTDREEGESSVHGSVTSW